jgi:hypothetical protein
MGKQDPMQFCRAQANHQSDQWKVLNSACQRAGIKRDRWRGQAREELKGRDNIPHDCPSRAHSFAPLTPAEEKVAISV